MANLKGTSGLFYLQEKLSPTGCNLSLWLQASGWKSCRLQQQADFSEANLAFNEEAALCLEYKHLLANLVAKTCPRIMPVTYCINDYNWPQVLSQLVEDYYRKGQHASMGAEPLAWILKPALLNNGQSINIFKNPDELAEHFSRSNRLGGEHVLQQYITRPHLLRDQRKYSIRHFAVLTNFAGGFLYPKGYFNVALHPYAASNFLNLQSHLTNEHLHGEVPNVIQIPTDKFDHHAALYVQIREILRELVGGLQAFFPQAFVCKHQRVFALFGVDFMVDASGRVWLLEVNHGPCFPIHETHPLQGYLYNDFWQNIIDYFVLPTAYNHNMDARVDHVFDKIISAA